MSITLQYALSVLFVSSVLVSSLINLQGKKEKILLSGGCNWEGKRWLKHNKQEAGQHYIRVGGRSLIEDRDSSGKMPEQNLKSQEISIGENIDNGSGGRRM